MANRLNRVIEPGEVVVLMESAIWYVTRNDGNKKKIEAMIAKGRINFRKVVDIAWRR
jgi:3-deoxy-D-manno-octulosonic-acid transferase